LSETYYYEITTYCPASRVQARIILQNEKLIKSPVVNGKPVDCSLLQTCKHKESAWCYLKSERVEARGKLVNRSGEVEARI